MLRRGRGRPPHPDILTPAEWRVLREIRTGATNAEIAVRLGLSIATVKFHIRNIRNKLHLTERAELVAWRGEPQPEGQLARRRRMLAPIGLLVGFWKPVVAGIAITVVGGSAIAAGVLAYVIVNDEVPVDPDSPIAAGAGLPGAATAPPLTASPTLTSPPTPEPSPTPAPPPATPTPTAETAAASGPLREVRGVILGPDGDPLEGWRIRVDVFPPYAPGEWDQRTNSVETNDHGTFTLQLRDGAHVFMLTSQCGDGWIELGWHGPDATFVEDRLEAVPIFVGETPVGEVVLRLPREPSSLEPSLCEDEG